MRPPSGWNSPHSCPLNLRWSAWVSTHLRWACGSVQEPRSTRLVNLRTLIAEKRAKETRCAPAKRLEITARLPFNYVLVRLGVHPHKEVLSGNF